jgi:hypothetical protein
MSSERVTVREYDTADDAKAAETLLIESGLTSDIVSRSGKKLRVVSGWEDEARSLLSGAGPLAADPLAPGFGDPVFDAVTTTPADEVMPPADYYVEDQGSGVSGAAASAADTARGAASSAAETAQSAASTVAGTAQSAASTATDTVQSAASSAAGTVQSAAATVSDTVQDVAAPVTDQLSKVTQPAAEQVHNLAQTVRQRGATPETPGVVRVPAETTADVLEKTSQYLRNPDLSIMVEDLRGAVRRSPVRSLLIGLGLGYLLRSTVFSGGAQGAQQSESGTSSTGGVSTDTTTDAFGAAPTYGYAGESDLLVGTDVASDLTAPDMAATADLPAADVVVTDDVMVFEADPVVVEDGTDTTDTTATGDDTTRSNTGV